MQRITTGKHAKLITCASSVLGYTHFRWFIFLRGVLLPCLTVICNKVRVNINVLTFQLTNQGSAVSFCGLWIDASGRDECARCNAHNVPLHVHIFGNINESDKRMYLIGILYKNCIHLYRMCEYTETKCTTLCMFPNAHKRVHGFICSPEIFPHTNR